MNSSRQTTDQPSRFMDRAVDLAHKGGGWTSPNPMVGAVVVKNGRVIGEGYHERFGGPHAEVNALKNCSESASGTTLYVSLEPCNRTGKTPPCSDLILQNKISKVVVGSLDPTQNGSGIETLRNAGVEVDLEIHDGAEKLNLPFNTFHKLGRPFVTVKMATTLDGKIAARSGESKWITSPATRVEGHKLRHESDAILVGIGTVEADNPLLTTRLEIDNPHHPIRIILDSQFRIPSDSNVIADRTAPTWVAATVENPSFEGEGLRGLVCKKKNGRVDLVDLMNKLAKENVMSLLVEGGPTVVTEFFKAGLVDRVVQFISPSYLGGEGRGGIGPLLIEKLSQRIRLKDAIVKPVGRDFMVEGEVDV